MIPRATLLVLAAALAVPTAQAQDKEATAKSRIVSVGLFKNGLAVVKREVTVPGGGTFRLDTDAEPVHGTFWIESDGKVEAAVKMRDVEMPLHASPLVNLQEELGGKKVTIHFRNDKLAPVSGTLLKLAATPSNEPAHSPFAPYAAAEAAQPFKERFYILQTPKGRLYVNPSDIAAVLAEDVAEKTTARRPVLVLTVEKADKAPTIYVTYLAHGLAWAPSYLVDISDPKTLSLEMAAVIRNELADVDGAEFRLISGFPSVEYAGVISPLAARMTWERFFQAIQHPGGSKDAILTQQLAVSNTAVLANPFAPGGPRTKLGAIPEGEGVDLYFQPVGKHALLQGEALSLTVGKAKAAYERVVEWHVGTSPVAQKYGGNGPRVQDEMWDVLYFRNPFAFPMTTAPAMVVHDGQFNGQRTSYWTNVGEESHLKVTKSLSVRALSLEQEDSPPNQPVVVDGKNYTKIFLKGELVMNNHRKQAVKVVVNHTIRGSILEVEGNPLQQVRPESLQEVNRAQDVQWTVTLQPGEEKRLAYRYSVLVYR
jgi:hypothetical protein